jgi:hypothetical protein
MAYKCGYIKLLWLIAGQTGPPKVAGSIPNEAIAFLINLIFPAAL